jgi:hypothetical protein
LEKEINGKFLGEAHRASVKVAERVTKWAKPVRNGSWELDSRLVAFAALGTALYGDEYMTSAVGREFEEVMMDVTEELPTWMPYNVPPNSMRFAPNARDSEHWRGSWQHMGSNQVSDQRVMMR